MPKPKMPNDRYSRHLLREVKRDSLLAARMRASGNKGLTVEDIKAVDAEIEKKYGKRDDTVYDDEETTRLKRRINAGLVEE